MLSVVVPVIVPVCSLSTSSSLILVTFLNIGDFELFESFLTQLVWYF